MFSQNLPCFFVHYLQILPFPDLFRSLVFSLYEHARDSFRKRIRSSGCKTAIHYERMGIHSSKVPAHLNPARLRCCKPPCVDELTLRHLHKSFLYSPLRLYSCLHIRKKTQEPGCIAFAITTGFHARALPTLRADAPLKSPIHLVLLRGQPKLPPQKQWVGE